MPSTSNEYHLFQTKGKRAYEQADRMAVESSKLAQKLNQAAMNVSEAAVALPTDLASASDADHLIPKINRYVFYRACKSFLCHSDFN